MILIADSGSTKCDWLLINGDVNIETKTMGFNPFFHDSVLIKSELAKNSVLSENKLGIHSIFFYGAGCSSAERNNIVKKALQSFFNSATNVVVDHDLTGAALAATGAQSGIACILGTGSNSCYFDGSKVYEEVPALGYILGDEGSGAYFGKILLSNFLYHKLPKELSNDLEKQHLLTKEEIFFKVYNSPNPNVYLASFMRFISGHGNHPYFQEMIYNGLLAFAKIHITCYKNYQTETVHFVGSIAYYFKSELQKVADDLGFTIGNIVKKPITALGDYHAAQTPTTQ